MEYCVGSSVSYVSLLPWIGHPMQDGLFVFGSATTIRCPPRPPKVAGVKRILLCLHSNHGDAGNR